MKRERLTNARIDAFTCPRDKQQAFLWDSVSPRLAVRATAGAKAFIFEGKLNRQTIRRTIGSTRVWFLDDARAEANRLQALLDRGEDPREIEREREAQKVAKKAAKEAAQRQAEDRQRTPCTPCATPTRTTWSAQARPGARRRQEALSSVMFFHIRRLPGCRRAK